MPWSSIAVPSLVLAVIIAPAASAQFPDVQAEGPPPAALQPTITPPPAAQQTVRLTVELPDGATDRVTGVLTAVGHDSMMLYLPDAQSVVGVPRDAVRRIEVSMGQRSRTGEGALKGLAIGTGVGLILGMVSASASSSQWASASPDALPRLTVGGAIWGALIGTIAGSVSRKTIWVDQDRLSVSPANLSVSYAF